MDGDALIEVPYSVGALVRSVRIPAAGLDTISRIMGSGPGDRASALAAADAALADAKRTADTSIASVVNVLEAIGESRP